MNRLDRYRGSLLGLAVGAALGAGVERAASGTNEAAPDTSSGRKEHFAPGLWTGDTSMALCLAASLVEKRGFHPKDQMDKYLRWYKEGYFSSYGQCFGIGATCRSALERFAETGELFCGSLNPRMADNGSLMRLAAVPLFYASRPYEALVRSGDSSLTTHGAITAIDACRYLGALIVGAVQGADKQTLLSERYTPTPGFWNQYPLVPEIDDIARGSYKRRTPSDMRATGNAPQCLEAALWALYRSETFEAGCRLAVSLGDAAAATGAVYGQLAGAYYGESGIPAKWLERIAQLSVIRNLADEIYRLSA